MVYKCQPPYNPQIKGQKPFYLIRSFKPCKKYYSGFDPCKINISSESVSANVVIVMLL